MSYVQEDIDNLVEDNVAKEVIATKEFQRLKNIQQLGTISKAFPAINHTRYEHSIGVYLRARDFIEQLEKQQGVIIDDFHKRCVKLAGLLHDVGHGPYSHVWEIIMKDINPGVHFTHEEVGAEIVENIFKRVRLSDDDGEQEYGVKLIKALIIGNKEDVDFNTEIEFIFDIINNKSSAIDVDRWDYLIRDWEHCRKFIQIPGANVDEHLENVRELFLEARVSQDRRLIQFNCHKLENINSMFELRQHFHENIYQCFQARVLNDILLKIIRLRMQEERYMPRFLTFTTLSKYVTENYCKNPIDEQFLEKWLVKSSSPEVHRLYKVFGNLQKYVDVTSNIPVKYNYTLPERIEDCLYNLDVQRVQIELTMHYEFTKNISYRIKEC